jgi:hypothetical protein
MQLSVGTKHLYKLVSFIPKLQHQHSKVQSPPIQLRVRDRNQTEAIKGIFPSSGGLFSIFGVASSTYINETKVKQPLVLIKKIIFDFVLMRAQNF